MKSGGEMMTVARDDGGQWLTVTSMVNGVPTEYSVRRDTLEIRPAVRTSWTSFYPLGIFLDSSGYPFDPDKATRDRHVDGLSQEVEAEQTLLTAQTEIAKLKAAIRYEDMAHAATRKLLGESNADHNKLVVKVAELEKKLGDIDSDPFKYLNGRGFRLGDASVVIKKTAEAEAEAAPAQIFDMSKVIADLAEYARLKGWFEQKMSSDEQDSRSARVALGAKPGEMAKTVDALKTKLAQSEKAMDHVHARCYRLEETIDKARKITGNEWGLTLEAAVTRVVAERSAERQEKDAARALIQTCRRVLAANPGESLDHAATRAIASLTEESNRRTAAEGRLAEIKRALGNEGLLA